MHWLCLFHSYVNTRDAVVPGVWRGEWRGGEEGKGKKLNNNYKAHKGFKFAFAGSRSTMPSDTLNKGGPGVVPAAPAARAFRQLWVAFFVCLFPLLEENFVLPTALIYSNSPAGPRPSISEQPKSIFKRDTHRLKLQYIFASLFSVSISGPFP